MPPGVRLRYTSDAELPSGFLSGPEFAALLEYLKTSDRFVLVADRKIDWARYQQEWERRSDGVVFVLDYPFERARGSWLPRTLHPTAHLADL